MSTAVDAVVEAEGASIAVRSVGTGPALLLLHGFPESRRMWTRVADILSSRFRVVAADLRGYGESNCPPSAPDHSPYSKREMATDMIEVMRTLGHERFFVAGHDRGGRVAYRMALDHPAAVRGLAVLDVLPVDVVWDRADDRMVLGFWPWSLLAQDPPLPEELLTASAGAIVDNALGPAWGTPAETFNSADRAAYAAMLADPAHAHAMCEEYRAAAGVDRDHDAHDRRHGNRIRCRVLALWSERGPLAHWYTDIGGPLGIWRELADDVAGNPVAGGHFFPEEHPEHTARALHIFFERDPAA